MRNPSFEDVVEAIDPIKHYVITDTNGWFMDAEKAKHVKAVGVEKVQLSLDSYLEAEHDAFRNRPGSYKRVMRAIDTCLDAGLNLILSTCLVHARARSQEFRDLCSFSQQRGIGLYVTYAKPVGSCKEHMDWLIDKDDADYLRELEKEFPVFTHMTPSYGMFQGCITVKGIITVTSTGEIVPCPYMDMSIGNYLQEPLKDILERGMGNKWLGPYRPDCLIGEDRVFIKFHNERVGDRKLLPVPYGEGFSDADLLPKVSAVEVASRPEPKRSGNGHAGAALFDSAGRLVPVEGERVYEATDRGYFALQQPEINYAAIHANVAKCLDRPDLEHSVSARDFEDRCERLRGQIMADEALRGLFHGVHVPFVMTAEGEESDLGEELDAVLLKGVERSFAARFPPFSFRNYKHGGMQERISVAPACRYEALLEARRKSPVVGWYFPTCLRGFGIPDQRGLVERLPAPLILSGPLEAASALIGVPELLMKRDGYPNLLALSAVVPAEERFFCFFEAYGWNLTFNYRSMIGAVSEYCAGGLTVIG